MNKRVKKLWIKALKSGKYRQGKRNLVAGGAYCCLGVLCDLYRKEKKLKMTIRALSIGKLNGVPNKDVVKWSSMVESNPSVLGQSLADRNDRGASFKEIAKLIEKHL